MGFQPVEKKFPSDFLWGASTSSHQVEGNTVHNDWWHYENSGRLPFASGQACRHYELYERDFDTVVSLGLNTYRFSLEWSRIEPEKGRTDEQEIAHYHRFIDALLERGITPVLVVFHFTLPLWFAREEGFARKENVDHFLMFLRRVAEEFSSKVQYWVISNEINVYAYRG